MHRELLCKASTTSSALAAACYRTTPALYTSRSATYSSDAPSSSVLTVPVFIQRSLDRRRRRLDEREDVQRRSDRLGRLRQGNRGVCLISCRDASLNHNLHQTYDKRTGPTLCSKTWNNTKAKGDHFTICRRQQPDEGADGDGGGCSSSSFSQLGVDPVLVKNLDSMGLTKPTEIQCAAFSALQSCGSSVLAAETGCGKTLGFLLPLVQRLMRTHRPPADPVCYNKPRALVITPGRELASQIKDVAWRLVRDTGLRTSLLLGTGMRKRMLNPQPVNMDILVASLGALNKMVSENIIELSRLEHVVLDEADTLLDDSFHEEVTRLLTKLNINAHHQDDDEALRHRQDSPGRVDLTLATATLPRDLDSLLEGVMMPGCVRRVIGSKLHQIQPNLEHRFLRVGSSEKSDALVEICRKIQADKQNAIVFSNSSQGCDYVSLLLNERGIACMDLSAAMHPRLRRGRWHAFLSGYPAILSCTDVVSRGLDPAGIYHVVNYEFPWNVSDYLHRAGRVGRAGSSVTGTVTSLVVRTLDVLVTQQIEWSVRKEEAIRNVDANIKRNIEKRKEHRPNPRRR